MTGPFKFLRGGGAVFRFFDMMAYMFKLSYIHIYIYVCVCIYIYIHIFLGRTHYGLNEFIYLKMRRGKISTVQHVGK